jgi:hypothetical protein
MKFAWPEIQKRLVSECGNKVAALLEEESSPAAGGACDEGLSGGEDWHRAEKTVAMPTTRKQITCRNLTLENDIPLPRMKFINAELPERSKPHRKAHEPGKIPRKCAVS